MIRLADLRDIDTRIIRTRGWVYELEGSITGVIHLDCNLDEHTYLDKFRDRISREYTQKYP
jgi:hypothetical protein